MKEKTRWEPGQKGWEGGEKGGRNQQIREWEPQGKWAGTRREGGWKQEGMGENQEQRCRN